MSSWTRTARRLAHGGFHGAGIQTFLAWLAARVELKDGDRQPEPRVLDEDAIVLTTWHSSKGREWPIVAVCGLDKSVEAGCRSSGLGYTTFEDLSTLLERARHRVRRRSSRHPRRTISSWPSSTCSPRPRGAASAVRGADARPRQAGARVAGLPGRQGRPDYWSILEQCGIARSEDLVAARR